MNSSRAQSFTKSEMKALNVFHVLAVQLSHARFMEFSFSVFALVYGICMLVMSRDLVFPVSAVGQFIPDHMGPYAALIAINGMAGVIGVIMHWKQVRLWSSMFLALLWAGLAWHFVLTVPPFPLGFVVYGFESLIEACIFVRVYADLDNYWQEISNKGG